MFSILYIQANGDIAKTVKEHFPAAECEFLIADSGEMAFTICEERKIFLIIVDSNIPDMKQPDFIKKCMEKYPSVYYAVCLDHIDISQISSITANPNVKKLFIAPWDIDEMVDEIMDTYDAYKIKQDFKDREAQLESDEYGFDQTLRHLKASLVRQKYSYNKLNPLFDKTLQAFIQRNTVNVRTADFIRMVCRKILLLETTATVNNDNLEKMMKMAVAEISDKYKLEYRIDELHSCIETEISRNGMANIVYLMYLMAGYEATKGVEATLSFNSRFLSESTVEIDISAELKVQEADNDVNKEANRELKEYMGVILATIGEVTEFLEEYGRDKVNIRMTV